MAAPRRIALRALGRDEDGFVLVLALGALVALTAVVASVGFLVTRNESASSRSLAVQRARSLAEAGLNDALAALYEAPNKLDAASVPATTRTLEGGSYTFSGALSGTTWTLTGSGTLRSPAGTAVPQVARTVSRQVQVVQQPVLDIWRYLYSDTLTGCMQVSNNATIGAPLYVRGNLCVGNNGHIRGSPLQVRGSLTLDNNSDVGTAASPLGEVRVGGGCLGQGGNTPHTCGAADRVYARLITSSVGTLAKPPVDLPGWYANAAPGPARGCANGQLANAFDTNRVLDHSAPAFDLAPASPYDCRVYDGGGSQIGRLSWTPGSPGTLVIDGVVFFDGDVYLSNNDFVLYSGRGTIYSSGSITLDNNSYLCGIAGCTASWNPNANLIVLVAGTSTQQYGFSLMNNSTFQGGAYVVGDYLVVNNGVNWGPVIANQLSIANNAGQSVPLDSLPVGAPAEYTTSLVPVVDSFRG